MGLLKVDWGWKLRQTAEILVGGQISSGKEETARKETEAETWLLRGKGSGDKTVAKKQGVWRQRGAQDRCWRWQ